MPADKTIIDTITDGLVEDEINRNGWSDEYAAHMRADVKFRGRCARQARAALQALLEAGPTEAMLKAMHDAVPLCDRARCDNVREVARAENLPKFAAAMRAALEEADNHG